MPTVYDVDANTLIERTASEFKKVESFQIPHWAVFVKTSHAKQRTPDNADWWYFRAASMLRKFYMMKGPIGVSKLRTKYGSKKNRGHQPEHCYKASGKITRTILQQLEKAGFVQQVDKKGHKGRIITAKGRFFLDGICKGMKK